MVTTTLFASMAWVPRARSMCPRSARLASRTSVGAKTTPSSFDSVANIRLAESTIRSIGVAAGKATPTTRSRSKRTTATPHTKIGCARSNWLPDSIKLAMSWERILQNDQPGKPLRQRIDDLFDQQRATWPTLRDGEASLQHLERKSLNDGDDSVTVQMNPARRRSTLANTDAKVIAARTCFLCPENMPPEERGVAFEDLVLLPNPFPILPLHCTIADRQHRPQQLRGRVATFLQ